MNSDTTRKRGDRRAGQGSHEAAASRRSPILWWRSVRAENFHEMALRDMRLAIAKVELFGEPRWREAAAGDAAAAIGIVLSIRLGDSFRMKFDVAMTALVVCAAEGNAAACIVLSNVIRRLPGAGKREARLATSWLVRAFRPVLKRNLLGDPA
jgi:hypothetical protein